MQYLPIDIKLNIIEYGIDCSLGINDIKIIERIRRYEPSFNYLSWSKIVKDKREFIDKVNNSPLMPLYQYLVSKGLYLITPKYESVTCIDNCLIGNVTLPEDTEHIEMLLSQTKYDISSVGFYNTFNLDVFIISSPDIKSIQKELLEINLLYGDRSRRRDERIEISYNTFMHEIDSTIPDILNIPDTLHEYLPYAIERAKKDIQLRQLPMYSVYKTLEKRQWDIWYATYGDEEDQLYIDDNDSQVDGNIRDLIKIDRFYHPCVLNEWYQYP